MNKEYIEEVVLKSFTEAHNNIIAGQTPKNFHELVPLIVAANAKAISEILSTLLVNNKNS